ncbi:aminotransferase class IV [Corynebacterium sp.]|uniref:aminotransferase class IV n=1 Tax=Corynebacterium sp. TaxID=1720 RepID=UPI0026DF6B8A|nr:aminotransferase class IV [Corynebacterium sp.]MDO5512407.1 aminotransferase class IV [Corynebacterium sp.]
MYRWDGSALVGCEEPDTAPDVVDSWLVSEGTVRNWRHHCARFGNAEFMAAVREVLPGEGAWFPRVEKHGCALYLRLRSAPPLRSQTVLWVPPTPDPRRFPGVKGPDLAVLGELRAQAREHGADDALLWTPDGLVVEGANCAIAWVEDGRFMVPEHPRQLPSTTVAGTRELRDVGSRPITVEELRTHPVWVGSALHGWTPVVGWRGKVLREGPARQAPGSTNGVVC